MEILKNSRKLKLQIAKRLETKNRDESFFPESSGAAPSLPAVSSVLFLLGNHSRNGSAPEPSLILNKRSKKVAQPGDLCCPGGSVEPRLDPTLSMVMGLPGMPLSRWRYWSGWRRGRPLEARWLSLMMAACLRESFEEMRLNPLCVKFLGPLPSHRLRMFRKQIYPMVGWGGCQRRFYPNWEVESIVMVPLRSLLNPDNYARFRLSYPPAIKNRIKRDFEDHPCFILRGKQDRETLWGVTYRIVAAFMELVFDFRPPALDSLPMVSGVLKEDYMGGGR